MFFLEKYIRTKQAELGIRRLLMRGLLRYQQMVIKKSLRFERWNVVLGTRCWLSVCLMDLSLFRAAPFHFYLSLRSSLFMYLKKIVDSYNSWPQRALNYTALIGLENGRENLSDNNAGAETWALLRK